MSSPVKIASNKDVLDSISMIVRPDVLTMHSSIYFIVSIPNEKDAITELEKLPFNPKMRIVQSFVFTDPLQLRAYIYMRVKTTTTAKTMIYRLERFGFQEIEIRVRLTKVKKSELTQALMGGFYFGKYPFPLRPYFREIHKNEKEFLELRGQEYREMRQKKYVNEIRHIMCKKGRDSDED